MAIRLRNNMKLEGSKVKLDWELVNSETGQIVPVGSAVVDNLDKAIALRELINNLGTLENKVKVIQSGADKWYETQITNLKTKLEAPKTKTKTKTKGKLSEEEIKQAKLKLFESLKKELGQ